MSHSNEPTARTKTALAPDLREMPDRAARAWTERMAVTHLGGPDYAVDSQSGATYVVDAGEGTCTCPDASIRGETCKHQRRVAIEITSRRVPPPGKRRADCVACNAETFVPEGGDSPALCSACRVDPGDVVLDRETGDRLVVARVTDRRADEVEIATAETTVANYPTNEGYPADDIVIEVRYLADAVADRPHRTYSVPRSRLRRTDEALIDA
jgi:hypothetical protein